VPEIILLCILLERYTSEKIKILYVGPFQVAAVTTKGVRGGGNPTILGYYNIVIY